MPTPFALPWTTLCRGLACGMVAAGAVAVQAQAVVPAPTSPAPAKPGDALVTLMAPNWKSWRARARHKS
ncbi:hypothetical protein [Ideonella paludis]|uniref:hypothetical protein n=1 Tax=Ideonella paludis TaxID=1233411 RepID=UPI003627E099